jgi:hypothetical protein
MNAKDRMQIIRADRPIVDRFEDLHPGQVFSVCHRAGDLYMKIVPYHDYNAVSLSAAHLEIFEDDVDVQIHLAELHVE